MMQNIERVTAHLAGLGKTTTDRDRRVLQLIPTLKGGSLHIDETSHSWRGYRFIAGAQTFDSVASPKQAFEAAKAFGRFQRLLSDFPAPRLNESIPDFHNTPKRVDVLESAIAGDVAGRRELAANEIAFALERRQIARRLIDANLPERVTHNDTKLNNVLLDDETGEGICVIDLDTVMPGLASYDFGDMVRTMTCAAAEDEQDLSSVAMEFTLFDAVLRGYLESAGGFLTTMEREHLVVGAKVIAYEQGIRFLADFLSGDTYYKVSRTGQNLDRCRTQFKLLASIEQQEDKMVRLLRSLE
jgi:Ser/Thr protein kinase RdoA (MazF antagonist)